MSGFVDAVVQRRTSSTDAAEKEANPDSQEDDEDPDAETDFDGAAAEQLHAKDQELSKLRAQVITLKAKQISDAAEIATSKRDLSVAQKQVEDCHTKTQLLASDGDAFSQLSLQVTELQKQLQAEQESCEIKSQEILALQQEKRLSLERSRALKKEQDDLVQEKKTESEQKATQFQTVQDASKKALAAEIKKYEELQVLQTTASEKILTLTRSIESKDVRIQELTRELGTEKETRDTNTTEIEGLKAAQKAAVTAENEALVALEDKLGRTQDSAQQLKMAKEALQSKLDEQIEAMAVLEKELAASKSDAATSKAALLLFDKNEPVDDKIAVLTSEVASLTLARANAQDALFEERKEVALQKATIAQLQEDAAAASTAAADTANIFKLYKSRLSDAETAAKELKDAAKSQQDTVQLLKTQLASVTAELKECSNRVKLEGDEQYNILQADKNREIQQLKRDLEAVTLQLRASQIDLQQDRGIIQHDSGELTTLRANNLELENLNAALNLKADHLQKQVQDLQAKEARDKAARILERDKLAEQNKTKRLEEARLERARHGFSGPSPTPTSGSTPFKHSAARDRPAAGANAQAGQAAAGNSHSDPEFDPENPQSSSEESFDPDANTKTPSEASFDPDNEFSGSTGNVAKDHRVPEAGDLSASSVLHRQADAQQLGAEQDANAPQADARRVGFPDTGNIHGASSASDPESLHGDDIADGGHVGDLGRGSHDLTLPGQIDGPALR